MLFPAVFFSFFATPQGLWDPSSLIRDATWPPAVKEQNPTTGPPGNSLQLCLYNWVCQANPWTHTHTHRFHWSLLLCAMVCMFYRGICMSLCCTVTQESVTVVVMYVSSGAMLPGLNPTADLFFGCEPQACCSPSLRLSSLL